MSHILTHGCLAQQHVELLPARTVLSILPTQGRGGGKGNSLGETVMTMLGFSHGGNSTPGAPGADGQPSPGESQS
jgi:hypothetical protein